MYFTTDRDIANFSIYLLFYIGTTVHTSKYSFINGDKYAGPFVDDYQNGFGTYIFAKGDKYVGQFENGTFHGKGTYTWAERKNPGDMIIKYI